MVVANCFSLSTATDDEQLHGRTRWMTWSASRRLLLGRLPWRWAWSTGQAGQAGAAPGKLVCWRRFLASWWCTSIYVDAMVAVSDCAQRYMCPPPPRPSAPPRAKLQTSMSSGDDIDDEDKDDSPEAYAAAVDAAMAEWGQDYEAQAHFSMVTTRFKHVGYVVLHLAWGVFAWIVFAYGRLVYNLLGPAAEQGFTKSWGIGIATGQVSDASGALQAALQAVLLATIVEALWLMSNTGWLESYLDFASVVGSVAVRRGTRRLRDVLATHKRHSFGVG